MPNQYEINRADQIVDVRPWSTRAAETLSEPGPLVFAIGLCAAVTLIAPILLPISLIASLVIAAASQGAAGWLPMRYPPGSTDASTGKPSSGILFLGNMEFDKDKAKRLPLESALDKFREAWQADDDLRKHMLVLGSTGSGKSELLKGIFFNALCWGSGFFVADGKADNKLPLDVFTLARFFGRDDDLLALNFLLAGKTPQQVRASRKRRTSKTNPFSTADSDTIIQMGTNLLPKVDGDAKNWQEKALSCWRGEVPALCWLRDTEGLEISVTTFQEFLALPKLEELYCKGYTLAQNNGGVWPESFMALRAYLEVGLPGFKIDRCLRKHGLLPRMSVPGGKPDPIEQEGTIYEQHGFRATQLSPALSLLDKTYGHIFADKYSEVDMIDVTLNNRILVMLIPSLERSAQEAESLGKLTVACLRMMMGRNLGADIEGKRSAILDNKATEARYPYIVALDELGYYFADGIAVMFAQARSLGFCMIAAAQDIEKLTEGSKAAEAGAMLANQVLKIFMRIDDANKTNEMIQKYLGKVNVALKESYEYRGMTGFKRLAEVRIAEVPVATLANLQSLTAGRAIITTMGQIFKISSFYVGGFLEGLRRENFHINRFLQVRATSRAEILEGVHTEAGVDLISLPIDASDDKQVRGQRMRDLITGHLSLDDPRELADAANYCAAHDRALGLVNALAKTAQALPDGVVGAKRGAVLYAAARRYVLDQRKLSESAAALNGGQIPVNKPPATVDDDFVMPGAALPLGDVLGSKIEHGSGSGEGGAQVSNVHDDPLDFINGSKPLERKPLASVLPAANSPDITLNDAPTKAGLEMFVADTAQNRDASPAVTAPTLVVELEPSLRKMMDRVLAAGLVIEPNQGQGASVRRNQHERAAMDAGWIGRALAGAAAGLSAKGDTVVGFTEETKSALVGVELALGNTHAGDSAAAVERLVAHQTTPAPLPLQDDLTADIDLLLAQAERALS